MLELQLAGYGRANGRFLRDGDANGFPKFKHETEDLWVRQGGRHRFWFLTASDGNTSRLKLYMVAVVDGYTQRPPRAGWQLAPQWGRGRAER